MTRAGVAISALALMLGVIQPGHGATVHGGAAVKADTRAVAGNHIVKAKSRHRLRSGRGFGQRRHGRLGRSFRHGRRHGRTRFFLSLAIPFAQFVLGPHGHHRYYRGQSFHYGRHGSRFRSYRYLRHCRKVVKFGHDRYGRRAKIGGTLCFDRYGTAYILSHSRHVIHYY